MKKIFVTILTLLIATLLLTGCNNNSNQTDVTITKQRFNTYEDLIAYTKTLDTNKYQVLGEQDAQGSRQVYWELLIIEKEANTNYETFEFFSYEEYEQFKEQIPATQLWASTNSYYRDSANDPYYVIFITPTTSTTPSISTEHEHSWREKDLDGETVKFCEECGKIEQTTTAEHSHTWDVKKVDGKIISFCTECGKIAEQ
jgi:hypothetical protein